MKNSFPLLALAGCAVLALSACNTVPRLINSQVQFPDVSAAWKPQGSAVTATELAKVKPSMSKAQVYETLGVPHFNNGWEDQQYWDYILTVKAPAGDVPCQLVLEWAGDAQRLTSVIKQLHWKDTASCGQFGG